MSKAWQAKVRKNCGLWMRSGKLAAERASRERPTGPGEARQGPSYRPTAVTLSLTSHRVDKIAPGPPDRKLSPPCQPAAVPLVVLYDVRLVVRTTREAFVSFHAGG